jgi:hypothetical protein
VVALVEIIEKGLAETVADALTIQATNQGPGAAVTLASLTTPANSVP